MEAPRDPSETPLPPSPMVQVRPSRVQVGPPRPLQQRPNVPTTMARTSNENYHPGGDVDRVFPAAKRLETKEHAPLCLSGLLSIARRMIMSSIVVLMDSLPRNLQVTTAVHGVTRHCWRRRCRTRALKCTSGFLQRFQQKIKRHCQNVHVLVLIRSAKWVPGPATA